MHETFFGPHITVEIKIDPVSGAVVSIRAIHPSGKRDIVIPPDWAADLTGTKSEIEADVKASFNGAQVRFV